MSFPALGGHVEGVAVEDADDLTGLPPLLLARLRLRGGDGRGDEEAADHGRDEASHWAGRPGGQSSARHRARGREQAFQAVQPLLERGTPRSQLPHGLRDRGQRRVGSLPRLCQVTDLGARDLPLLCELGKPTCAAVRPEPALARALSDSPSANSAFVRAASASCISTKRSAARSSTRIMRACAARSATAAICHLVKALRRAADPGDAFLALDAARATRAAARCLPGHELVEPGLDRGHRCLGLREPRSGGLRPGLVRLVGRARLLVGTGGLARAPCVPRTAST